MEKYIDVMKQSTELLDTAYEGLQHMQKLLKEGRCEETIPLFGDIVQAFATIENSIINLPEEVVSEGIKPLTTKVRKALDIIVNSYEIEKYGEIQEVLQLLLLPYYKRWKEELENAFKPYLISLETVIVKVRK